MAGLKEAAIANVKLFCHRLPSSCIYIYRVLSLPCVPNDLGVSLFAHEPFDL